MRRNVLILAFIAIAACIAYATYAGGVVGGLKSLAAAVAGYGLGRWCQSVHAGDDATGT